MSKSSHCSYCQSRVLASWRTPAVWYHSALVIATCGLWLPFALVLVRLGSRWVCNRCGTEVS